MCALHVPTKVKMMLLSLKVKMQMIVSYLIKGWGLNSGSLEDQQVPLAIESSLQHQPEWLLLTQPLFFFNLWLHGGYGLYVFLYYYFFMYLIFLLSLRCYSQKKDNLRALMIFQKDLHLPVARCKSRGVTILLPVYDGLPFLTSRWVWNPIISGFRSSVENFESYCLYLCSVSLWKPLSTIFLTLKKDLSRSCHRRHMTFLNWLPFYVCLWPNC